MPRERKRLQSVQEGNLFFVRFRHPTRGSVVCVGLGGADEQATNLAALNRIWMTPDYWHTPPAGADIPDRIRRAWLGSGHAVKLKTAPKGSKTSSLAIENARLKAGEILFKREIERLLAVVERKDRELEHWRGKKVRSGPYPTLGEALAAFKAAYTGKDPNHTENVLWDLQRFVDKFIESTRIDNLVGREREISGWLHGLKNKVGKPLSPSRRMQWLWYILRLLRESGVELDKTKIDRISRKKIKEARGRIRYLPKPDAEKLASALPDYWRSAFKVQCTLGLRPEELPSLHRENFNAELSELTLAPRGHLTLKTGPRSIPVPSELRDVIRGRLALNDILFTQKAKGKKSKNAKKRVDRLWDDPKMFDRQYVKALRAAAGTVEGIDRKLLDARVGRRCCASWMLQQNIGADRIAKLLGNTAQQIIDAYGDPDTGSLNLGAMTALKEHRHLGSDGV